MQPLFIAVGGPHDTLAGLVLVAVFDRSETGGLTVFPPRGAGVLTIGGGGQSAAHAGTDLPHDLAVACAAFAERHGLALRDIAFMGDDVNDLEAMAITGHSAAPAHARPAVLRAAASR